MVSQEKDEVQEEISISTPTRIEYGEMDFGAYVTVGHDFIFDRVTQDYDLLEGLPTDMKIEEGWNAASPSSSETQPREDGSNSWPEG
ncbi:hypothetical protein ACJEI5_24940, partial [Escherichia coli]